MRGGREAALQALMAWDRAAAPVDATLSEIFADHRLEPGERSLATELACGSVRHLGTLDHVIARLTGRSLQRIQRPLLVGMRAAAYSLLFLERLPAGPAVSETVDLVRSHCGQGAAGMANAVLRRLSRACRPVADHPDSPVNSLPMPPEPPGPDRWRILGEPLLPDHAGPDRQGARRLAVLHSHPEWLVERWIQAWGEETAERVLRAGNRRPRTCLRVNSARADADLVTRRLADEGVACEPGPLPGTLVLEAAAGDPGRLSVLRDGLASVQDPAAGAAVELLEPRAGERILDLCAAPGGKTAAIAERLAAAAAGSAAVGEPAAAATNAVPAGEVVAVDAGPARLRKVEQTAARLGLVNIRCHAADGTATDSVLDPRHPDRPFDAALVDVPCTNTGVLCRRVEARWRVDADDLEDLPPIQAALLRRACRAVRPGGRVVYSTCSLEVEEDVWVAEMIAEEQGMNLETDALDLPDPTAPAGDGAYRALLVRPE